MLWRTVGFGGSNTLLKIWHMLATPQFTIGQQYRYEFSKT